MLIGDADVVVRPCFDEVEVWSEVSNQIDSGRLVGVLSDEHALLALIGVVRWRSHRWATLIGRSAKQGLWLKGRMIG